MISMETKTNATPSSPISLSTQKEEPTLSFSELLRGAGKKDAKALQNGTLALSLGADSKEKKEILKVGGKTESLLSLLKNDEPLKIETEEPVELSPKLMQNLSPKELKVLIMDAKQFLKSKILNSEAYKKLDLQNLPKTLKGLASLAKKVGIDISKISMQEVQISQDPKPALLFKTNEAQTHSTQEIVQAKQSKIKDKTSKEKSDNALNLLLRGEKTTQSPMVGDISASVANVIAPQASKTNLNKSLESLLRGDKQEDSVNTKTDALFTHKSDSLEVKLNEAKQMIKYISSDVKTALEDYKSPFTRIKVQLNPQKLGEVDLTVIQRGKNLHVNISSNNTAINTLSMNVNELKVQLSNNGINNATLNFNNSSQHGDQQASQQQNHQNERKAEDEYNYFESEETNEEILSSLEIVVPNYA